MSTNEILTLVRDSVDGWKIVTSVTTVQDETQPVGRRGGDPLRPVGLVRRFRAIDEPEVRVQPPVEVPAVPTNKYELRQEGDLFRIVALRTFLQPRAHRTIRVGEQGGLVSGSQNLSQEGGCWIGQNARVTGRVRVLDDAYVTYEAVVDGNGFIGGTAYVGGDVRASGQFEISGNAQVVDSAKLNGDGISLSNNVVVGEKAVIGAQARLGGDVYVIGEANLSNVSLNYGRFGGRMRIRNFSDFLVVATRWGALMLAKSTAEQGYEFMVGCQRPDDLQELEETLSDNSGSEFELAVLQGYKEMARAAGKVWGLEL